MQGNLTLQPELVACRAGGTGWYANLCAECIVTRHSLAYPPFHPPMNRVVFFESGCDMNHAVPVLRIGDFGEAKAFYVDWLGFSLEWEFRFGDDFPVYAQIGRDGITLH